MMIDSLRRGCNLMSFHLKCLPGEKREIQWSRKYIFDLQSLKSNLIAKNTKSHFILGWILSENDTPICKITALLWICVFSPSDDITRSGTLLAKSSSGMSPETCLDTGTSPPVLCCLKTRILEVKTVHSIVFIYDLWHSRQLLFPRRFNQVIIYTCMMIDPYWSEMWNYLVNLVRLRD